MRFISKYLLLSATALLCCCCIQAAEKLGVAEPVNKGGLPKTDIEAVWGMIEANVNGDFELVTRSALNQMLTESGLVESSGMVDPAGHKAEFGKLKGIRYLLVPVIGKFGSRLNLTVTVIDSSTGTIDKDKRFSLTVASLDELADQLRDSMIEVGLAKPAAAKGISALLYPVIKQAGAPAYLSEDVGSCLESSILNSGVRLRSLKNLTPILRKNKIGSLDEAEPALFVRVGELLRADLLIQPTVTRFTTTVKKVYIEVTRTNTTRCIGNIEGTIRVIAAATGEVVASVPFAKRVDFSDIDEDTDDWADADYGKYLIRVTMGEAVKKTINQLK